MNASGVFSSEQLSPDANSFPVIYEAAILYAADYYDAARETLKEHMKTDEGKSSIRTWLMLFDLLQLTHNRREFEALSMMFTVQFERSPPAWTAETGNTDPRRKEKREESARGLFFLRRAVWRMDWRGVGVRAHARVEADRAALVSHARRAQAGHGRLARGIPKAARARI